MLEKVNVYSVLLQTCIQSGLFCTKNCSRKHLENNISSCVRNKILISDIVFKWYWAMLYRTEEVRSVEASLGFLKKANKAAKLSRESNYKASHHSRTKIVLLFLNRTFVSHHSILIHHQQKGFIETEVPIIAKSPLSFMVRKSIVFNHHQPLMSVV